jgi:hypothetical protein
MATCCAACNKIFNENPFRLLDNRLLCPPCYKVIKSGKWCANPEFSFLESPPEPPTLLKKMVGKLSGSNPQEDYEIRLEKYSRRKKEYISAKKLEREFYHEICTYWPQSQPPDWWYRVNGARKRAENKCQECGESSDTLHVHHKILRSQGGNHDISNLIVLCTRCHSNKEGEGHKMILPPRSQHPDKEAKASSELAKRLGIWRRQKANSNFSCFICNESIKKGNKYYEKLSPIIKKEWEGVRSITPNRARKEKLFIIKRARKDNPCNVCNRIISRGEDYINIKYVYEIVNYIANLRNFRYGKIPVRICLDCCLSKGVCMHCRKRYLRNSNKLLT